MISIILGKLKRITSTFIGTAVIATAIVGALALCAWFSYVMFKTYLETPHTYGDTRVTPFGHHMDGPITHSWDSVQIENNGTVVTLKNIAFDLSILGDEKGLTLGANEVNVNINTEGPEKPKKPPSYTSLYSVFPLTKRTLLYFFIRCLRALMIACLAAAIESAIS